ncbi:MAG: NADH-quinone oxidoreductase subunit N [Phycisphaerales bacterium]|nr:MAG: NADH-quinone oxidoreductase subunit N [Phycisphaerales bacterium]
MIEKLWFLIPEIILFIGVCVVSIMGLSHHRTWRSAVPGATIVFLIAAALATPFLYTPEKMEAAELLMPRVGWYFKVIVGFVSVLLALMCIGLIDRRYEAEVKAGRASFDPMRVNRGEFFIFFLLSVMGVNLICSANDLIWLFLALELVSLPTYVMVAMSRPSRKAQEAAVKYFFLGAMATGVFLYGFALLYGSTGTIVLTEMRDVFAAQVAEEGGVNLLGIVGMIVSLLGVAYKIAAAPMHFYVADVYEGAASAVSAFLAFVPKAAGFLGMILLLGTMGWAGHAGEGSTGLPMPIVTTLWMIAAITMTLGNVGALLQTSVKRMLAYSSVAHSGYMVIGLIAGPGLGINGVLFYLTAYGIMNTAAFAVLAGLERKKAEIETVDDLAGLRFKHPSMAIVMAISAASLLGVPPLLGFMGKLYIFVGGVETGHIPLVIIAGLNSAISAGYYLYLIGLPILSQPSPQAETITTGEARWPRLAGVIGAVLIIVLPVFTNYLYDATERSTEGYLDEQARQIGATDADEPDEPPDPALATRE